MRAGEAGFEWKKIRAVLCGFNSAKPEENPIKDQTLFVQVFHSRVEHFGAKCFTLEWNTLGVSVRIHRIDHPLL
jgi:hypothetical protein